MDKSSSQKIRKEIIKQNSWISFTTIDFSNNRRVSTLLSARGTFIITGHILNHKTHLNTLERIEPIQWLLSDHNEIKLEINNRKSTGKSSNTWRLYNTLRNNPWVKVEISKEIFKYFKLNENENTSVFGDSEKSA